MEGLTRNSVITEMHFHIAADLSGGDIYKMYDLLMKSKIDEITFGFWVWDLVKGIELYSPNFRKVLGYEGEHDFPSVPESWQNAIHPEDLLIANENFIDHVESKGEEAYLQKVTYYSKQGHDVDLYCHGKVYTWKGELPVIAAGVHLSPTGLFLSIQDSMALKFKQGNKSVCWREICTIPDHYMTIAAGCDVRCEKIISETERDLSCVMKAGTILDAHTHKDYKEMFTVIEGKIKVLHSGEVRSVGESITFNKGVEHKIKALTKSKMIIKCIYG